MTRHLKRRPLLEGLRMRADHGVFVPRSNLKMRQGHG